MQPAAAAAARGGVRQGIDLLEFASLWQVVACLDAVWREEG